MKWVPDTVCRSPLAGRAANIFLKVPVMARPGCYNENNEKVNCKSEGNVLGVEKEPKGDAHFCK